MVVRIENAWVWMRRVAIVVCPRRDSFLALSNVVVLWNNWLWFVQSEIPYHWLFIVVVVKDGLCQDNTTSLVIKLKIIPNFWWLLLFKWENLHYLCGVPLLFKFVLTIGDKNYPSGVSAASRRKRRWVGVGAAAANRVRSLVFLILELARNLENN